MLAAYVNLYAIVSIRHAETGQSEQVYTHRAIDTRCHIILAKLIPGRIIGPYATLYLCYVNSRAVDFTRRPRAWTAGASLHALYCELVCKVKARDALRG